jgi:glycosyltransferase involved in cell wall biosynthesis
MNHCNNFSAGPVPRVAFFTDSFHEANGVALTSRQFAAYAKSHFHPFFSVHAGERTAHWKRGTFETFEVAHSRWLLHLEHDLAFDLLFGRHLKTLGAALKTFQPDLIHVTGPGHMGMLGALLARELRVPLVASWHTNVHEFGTRRLQKMMPGLPSGIVDWTERAALDLAIRFYRLAKVLFAPNPELIQLLAARTGKPVHLMQRGIDVEQFSPLRRPSGKRPFTIGYVGRLSAEKNVRLLAEIDAVLRQAGLTEHQFLIVGEGSERAWLREHIPGAHSPGLLRGEELALAYASMDAFVFPSETDTFGNVILEAAASGVPSVVSAHGGPKFLVEAGTTGFVAKDAGECAAAVAGLIRDPNLREQMGVAARGHALGRQWSAVFELVYREYGRAFQNGVLKGLYVPQKTFSALPVS